MSTVQPDAPQGDQPQQVKIEIDISKAPVTYVNFYGVLGTAEDLILDLGFTPNPTAQISQSISVSQRIVMNYYTAKRMLQAIAGTVQQYEQMFGVLETDIGRRVRPGFVPQQPQG